MFFFFNDTATTEIYTLSLHDALPISEIRELDISHNQLTLMPFSFINTLKQLTILNINNNSVVTLNYRDTGAISRLPYLKQVSLSYMPKLKVRSEEHTSELQSQFRISYAVFCLKKKKKNEKKRKKKKKKTKKKKIKKKKKKRKKKKKK